MRLVKVDPKNTSTTNIVVPKKASPSKKSPKKMTFFKDLESMSQTNKGKEVRSLTSYYENLNKSVSSKPNALSSSQNSNSIAIMKKRASASATATTKSSPSKQQQQQPAVAVQQSVAAVSSAETTPVHQSPNAKSVAVVAEQKMHSPAKPLQQVVATPSPSKVPKEVETIRETVDVYRTKIVELEKRLEREILSSKSLKQELMLMNDVHKKEVHQLHREIEEREDHVEELYEKLETKDYSLLDMQQFKEDIDMKNATIERLEEEIHQAEEYCYEIRKEQEGERHLIDDYKKELLDCQTLVAYYQEEFGKKCNEFNDLQRRFSGQTDELKQYKSKIQSFLQLLDTQERLKEQLAVTQPSTIKSPSQTPKKENSSSYFNSSNQTPVSAKKKTSFANVNTSTNTSVFKSPNPLSKQRTPKKVLCSPRSVTEYI